MKKIGIFILSLCLLNSCSDNDDSIGGEESYDYTEIIEDFVDNTAIPTYADMKDNSIAMLSSVEAFVSTGAQADLDQACLDWKATRKAWESSEAFLFGPADYQNLDPLLDSWPLDQAQLDQVLAGNQELTADFVREGLGALLRGFHTLEYLLFRDGAARTAADVTDREKEYLAAVTEVLRDDCITLWALWAGVEDGTLEAEVMDDLGVDVSSPFGTQLKNAGQAGSSYLSQINAVEEIIEGMIGIADEVANGKIAEPVGSGNVLDVESWFSWNSLTDFKNNIRSIQNSYINGYDGSTPGASLSAYVAEMDASVDASVKAKIQASLDALNDIPEPFRNNLNNEEKTTAAINAINVLATALQNELKPLVVQ